ncbi:phytoene/squalene synthase family protein [Plastoroseomonas hellenica]|uniref:phytoene/squalene synthase family protein n=1 Tax=Plastoroseomonas hellenica TaxID=2687306 RepID=UPI001BA65627|nr:phytoene/squalene synthase family protein [Plastoroseomonas hellenica]MBR0641269.1 phytoene/squalene synthase family protein [Plastoroseomonas hellenica]
MSDAVLEHSAAALTRGSSSFALASRLFDRELRQDVRHLYAWCRHCDDAIDGQDHGMGMAPPPAEEQRDRLRQLRLLTEAALDGKPVAEPAFAAFQRVAVKHRLRREWPMALLDGFAVDVQGGEFGSVEDTLAYCWRVAGVVGVMMAAIMGTRDPAALRRAQDLGIAFQLTNICRDLLEDAAQGRLYLPRERLDAAGVAIAPGLLLDADRRAAIFPAVREMLTLAEAYYASARIGLRALPFRAALAVAVARALYREIGRRILRQGPAALQQRMHVPAHAKAWLLIRGVAAAVASRWERLAPFPPRPPLWSMI